MANFTLPLLSVKQESENVQSFSFGLEKEDIPYQAGQFLRLTLPQVMGDSRGSSRFFSIASSPTEKHILLATRMSESPFKQALGKLRIGDSVQVTLPFGKFSLTDKKGVLHVFLTGGIGITPIRSLIHYATETKLPHRLLLLYSNRTPHEILFKEDLDEATQENSHLTIIHTITRPKESQTTWNGKTGRIDERMIREYVSNLQNAVFYVCGSPAMVEGLYTIVKDLGIGEESIKTERFTGYQ